MGLTKKQKEILDFIKNYIVDEGVSPTFADIQKHFNFKSKGSVFDYITYLKKSGHLKSDGGGIELAELPESNILIPLLGKVAAGSPLQVYEALGENEFLESLSVPQYMLSTRGNYYALKVEGDSMIEDCIANGDHIVIKSQKTAHQGETVVALVEGGATVKKFYKKRGRIELHPANSTMSPIIVKDGDFKIQGVLVGLIRSY